MWASCYVVCLLLLWETRPQNLENRFLFCVQWTKFTNCAARSSNWMVVIMSSFTRIWYCCYRNSNYDDQNWDVLHPASKPVFKLIGYTYQTGVLFMLTENSNRLKLRANHSLISDKLNLKIYEFNLWVMTQGSRQCIN